MKGVWRLVLVGGLIAFEAVAEDKAKVELFDEPKAEETSQKKRSGIMEFLNFSMPEMFADSKEMPASEQIVDMAAKGDVDAQLMLGYSYLYGENGMPVDYEKAFEYYALAAQQNNVVALNNLGSLYYNGVGIGRNTKKAAEFFEKAAKAGNPDAAVNLGFMYISGNGAPMDKEKAMLYFDKAADAGNTMAGFMVGYAYYIGRLREKNYVKAAPMIKKAADMGFDEAQLIMAEIYANGYGFPQNYGNAVRYLRNAVDQGSTVAMMHLADILSSGNMYNKDIASAHILYNLAAVRGVSGAAEKRALLEKTMKINDVLRAQADAESYVEKPSEVTKYVRQTYGDNVRSFVY